MNKELWCLHIEGPDDVHAAPSKEEAEKCAVEINAFFSEMANRLNVNFTARAIIWPHSARLHAEDVLDWEPCTTLKARSQGGAE